MEINAEHPETWKNLKNISVKLRGEWIKARLPIILRTLERHISSSAAYQNDPPWDMIGFICLNDGLYKEAEHIYDEMARRSKSREETAHQLIYCRGIARFFQGKFKDAYEDFKLSRQMSHAHRQQDVGAIKAIAYMEDTIFPMIDMVIKTKEKLRHDLNTARFIERSVGPNILKTLHKWNSSSPLFSSNVSQGGGYLMTLRNHIGAVHSIAIDPGYDFIDIFRDMDLSIADLDAMIVTHDHDDHTESIEAILSLLAKYNDHVTKDKAKVIDIFGSPGVMLKYQGLFNALDPWGNREVHFKLLIPGSRVDHIGPVSLKEKYGCVLHPVQAFHQELWTHEESAVGIVIETEMLDGNNDPIRIGITGDTRYESGIGHEYKGCQALLLNIGSLEKEEGKMLPQHLGLLGCINMIKEARPKIAILTEFGEEFRGKRATVSSVMEDWAMPMEGLMEKELFRVMPADINFELRLSDLNVKETSSKVFLPLNMIEVDESDPDSIVYRMKDR